MIVAGGGERVGVGGVGGGVTVQECGEELRHRSVFALQLSAGSSWCH